MEKIKSLSKHLALPLLAGMILFLTVMLIRLHADKDEWSIDLHDIEGDRAVLANAVIEGDFRDGFHRTYFSIEQGQVQSNTEVFGHPHYTALNTAFNVWFDGVEYNVYNDISNQIVINSKDFTNPKQLNWERAIVRMSVTNIHTDQTTFTNQIEYGLAKAGERLFFTVPTTKHYVGMNGIYALEFGEVFDDHLVSKRIVDLSLEVNRENPSLSVLGLEAVGDRLALLLVDGERLVVQVYRTDGEAIGEAEVPGFTIPDVNKKASAGTIVHSESYESFADEQGLTLTLSFRSSESTSEETVFTYLSFDLSDNVEWIGMEKGRYLNQSINHNDNHLFAQRVGDRLIVFRALTKEHERLRIFPYMLTFIIDVYKDGQRVYRGELMTDVNDDLIDAMNQSTGYSYSWWQHRRLFDIQIEPAI